LRICLLTKFPPIQGGIAAKSYWLARGLAEAGNEVYVVTNACSVEEQYRIAGCEEHLKSLTNIRVHDLGETVPWHIPFSKTYTIRLLNLALEVVKEHNPHVLDAGFLVPYGVVAYLTSMITGLPYIIRHGYSDLAKFFSNPEYNHLLSLVIKNANLIVTDHEKAAFFHEMNERIAIIQPYVPDERQFKPSVQKETRKRVISYVGKINYHWQNKRLIQLVKKIDDMFEDYELIFMAQGIGIEHFRASVEDQINIKIIFKPFLPPWEMPSFFSSVDYIALANDTVIQSPSNIHKEAQCSGKSLVMLDEGDMRADGCSDYVKDGYNFESWITDNINAMKKAAFP